MRIEVQTTTLGKLKNETDDVLRVICESDEELQLLTKPTMTMHFGEKTYSFKNHQSYGNKNGQERIVWLYAD